ncbi:MAG: hypothetical protein EOP24_39090 [Hyphomicrobiales bacterium]|nr:MAG: hypothetical protein EOP24_39090 [Hyphomicrobiales bacterium]
MKTYSVADVVEMSGLSEWTLKELVRTRRVSCIRVGMSEGNHRPIRFTDEQVAEVFAALTVAADTQATPEPRRRKRRAS